MLGGWWLVPSWWCSRLVLGLFVVVFGRWLCGLGGVGSCLGCFGGLFGCSLCVGFGLGR